MKTSKFSVDFATLQDVVYVSNNLREEDIEEAMAAYGETVQPWKMLMGSFLVSRDTTFAMHSDGVPFCIVGCRPPSILSNTGTPWMVGTNQIRHHGKSMTKFSKALAKVWSDTWPVLQNYVYEKNHTAIRWLHRIGFELYYPQPYGTDGKLFHRFCMRSGQCAG